MTDNIARKKNQTKKCTTKEVNRQPVVSKKGLKTIEISRYLIVYLSRHLADV